MIDIALLDPHPVVHKGFNSFFRKTEHIRVVATFSNPDQIPQFLENHRIDALILEMELEGCLLYTSPSPRDRTRSRMPSSA